MPKLWDETIKAHRSAVADAILDATAALVTEQGLSAVTMSLIATRSRIGRATLYKYYPDLEAILSAWHERQVARHLLELAAIRSNAGSAVAALKQILATYAQNTRPHSASGLAMLLHHGVHAEQVADKLGLLVADVIAEGARDGDIRRDASAEDLAAYCLHAIGAAGHTSTKPKLDTLVDIILAGLRRPEPTVGGGS